MSVQSDTEHSSELLDVRDLRVAFHGDRGRVTEAVAGTSFTITPGTTLGIVGEFGLGQERHRPRHHASPRSRQCHGHGSRRVRGP